MKKEKKIICKTCYYRKYYGGKHWCSIIENESGGNIEANLTKCPHYLKKGTEPKWLCDVCGKNTFGHNAHGKDGKWYCDDCWWEKENKKWAKEKADKHKENVKKISQILGGDKEKAEKILKIIEER